MTNTLDNQSREVAALRGVLSTTETQVQLQRIIVKEKAKKKKKKNIDESPISLKYINYIYALCCLVRRVEIH